MTLGIHVFIQLWNPLPEKSKSTKRKIIYTKVMKNLFVQKKNDIKLTTLAKRQNLCFAHSLYSKNKHYNWQLWSGLTMKLFYSEMFFGLDWEEITSYGQKHFQETIIVSATKAMCKQQSIIYGKFYSLIQHVRWCHLQSHH